jgi:hypothetical protein
VATAREPLIRKEDQNMIRKTYVLRQSDNPDSADLAQSFVAAMREAGLIASNPVWHSTYRAHPRDVIGWRGQEAMLTLRESKAWWKVYCVDVEGDEKRLPILTAISDGRTRGGDPAVRIEWRWPEKTETAPAEPETSPAADISPPKPAVKRKSAPKKA